MAQALPRFCPRCGTPTRANMHVCPTCGLPAEAMLSRSGNIQENNSDADSQEQASEPARIVPTSPYEQQDWQARRSPLSPSPDSQPPWTPSGQAQPSPRFSPAEPSQGPWDTLRDPAGTPDVEEFPTQVEQLPFPSAPAQNPREVSPHPISQHGIDEFPTEVGQQAFSSASARPSGDFPQKPISQSGIEEFPTQVGQQAFPSASARPSRDFSQNPISQSGIEEFPTQVGQQVFSSQPSFVPNQPNQWNATNNPPSMPGGPTPWSPPADQARPPALRPERKRRRGVVVVVVLLVVLIFGGGAYLAYSLTGGHLPGLSPSQSSIKTTKLNIPVTYAGMDITILNVQQAQNFLSDPQTANDGMLRLNLQEQNKTNAAISWNYSKSALLLSQGAAPIAPVYVKSKNTIAPGATETSIIDFPIANGGNLNRLTFQLGTASEAKQQVPLTGQAGVDRYGPKTSQQNGTLLYFGLNWTLTSVTTSLSIPGQQAPSGMEFLILTLKVDNTLSQEAITGSPFDYLRVKAGGQTVAPVDTTLPISFATGEMGKTGTATFLIPQNSSACTLILLSQDPGTSGQATTDFQVG
jgi:hypothetical protein